MYEYKIKNVLKMYDGDTITVEIDLGMDVTIKQTIRLYGINAPEIRGEERPEGLLARDWIREQINDCITNGCDLYIKTIKDKSGKYGRLLGIIYLESLDTTPLNDQLVLEGHAVYQEY